ncbi:FAD binding domain-containing protein [bacterium]|nr:FAD binding domain-containing protein [bacterium]
MAIAHRPRDFAEALRIRAEEGAMPFAGGTDLMVRYKRPLGVAPQFGKPVLLLGHLDEIRGIRIESGSVRIGAGTTLTEILKSDIAPEVLRSAIAQMASIGTRNIATIGGNICNASPAGDTLPPLYAMDAALVLESIRGERAVPIAEFIVGPSGTTLGADELLREIVIPIIDYNKMTYKKSGTRRATALSKLSFLGLAKIDDKKIADIRIAFGAVAPTVVRSREIEKALVGSDFKNLSELIPWAIERYGELIRPIDDQRSTAEYRKESCLRLLKTFLEEIL